MLCWWWEVNGWERESGKKGWTKFELGVDERRRPVGELQTHNVKRFYDWQIGSFLLRSFSFHPPFLSPEKKSVWIIFKFIIGFRFFHNLHHDCLLLLSAAYARHSYHYGIISSIWFLKWSEGMKMSINKTLIGWELSIVRRFPPFHAVELNLGALLEFKTIPVRFHFNKVHSRLNLKR